jgi:sodium-dependent dicarboxylate transporter 2/3/5
MASDVDSTPNVAPGGHRPRWLLTVPAAANLSGMCTIIGTPPNALVCTTGLVDRRALLRLGLLIGLTGTPLAIVWTWLAS